MSPPQLPLTIIILALGLVAVALAQAPSTEAPGAGLAGAPPQGQPSTPDLAPPEVGFVKRTRTCDMRAAARDFFDRPPEHFYTCSDTATGESLDVTFDMLGGGRMDIGTGDVIEIDGSDDGASIRARAFKTLSRNPNAYRADAARRRERRAASARTAMVVIVRFVSPNGTFIGSSMDTDAERTATALTVNNTLFGIYNSNSVRTHAGAWYDCSYGQLVLNSDTDGIANDFAVDYPGSNTDIFYVDVPINCTNGVSYCKNTYNTTAACGTNEYYGWTWFAFAQLAATRPGFNKDRWQHKVFVIPSGPGVACDFVGLGNVDCTTTYCNVWIPSTYANKLQDYTHEMGHNLGLAHSGDATLTSSLDLEYGDHSCAMGYCCTTRCYNAPHAYELGWVTPILSLTRTNLADQQRVTQILPSLSVSSQGAMFVTVNWGSGATYWIQLKTSDNYDRFASTSWLNNVQIKRWDFGHNVRVDHLWRGSAGASWSDPTGQLHVLVNGINLVDKTANITIKRGLCPSGFSGSGFSCVDINECSNSSLHNCSTNAVCTNTPGSFSCACRSGYAGTGVVCADIDECVSRTSNCSANAACANTQGGFTCTCNSGFVGNGTTCVDVNECSNSSLHNCNTNALCTNTPGSYSCACNKGFAGNGTSCADVDECFTNTDNCHDDAACTNSFGSFSCACNSGYSGNGTSCTDINECSANTDNCHDDAICTNLPGRFSCACNSGYAGNGTSCADIDECTAGSDNCHDDATCTNSIGSFSCKCNLGYAGNGVLCADIDECATGADNCHDDATCTNSIGSFSCKCNSGYAGGGVLCEDIDECATNADNCHDDATCTNSIGSFLCKCNPGYAGNGVLCEDIDECATGADDCHDDATCTNSIGSFSCKCNSGYAGNGTLCEDIDECASTTDDCHDDATCTNSIGSFSCKCNSGYAGNGVLCEDIDECTAQTDDCHDDATCTNSIGSFSCKCNSGYAGNGTFCEDLDECSLTTDDCHSDATCTNAPGSFSCACNLGFAGNGTSCADIDECADKTHNCSKDAMCTNSAGAFSCACNVDYEGDGVSCTEIDYCAGVTCLAGGTCVKGTCFCVSPFQGPRCDQFPSAARLDCISITEDRSEDAGSVHFEVIVVGDLGSADGFGVFVNGGLSLTLSDQRQAANVTVSAQGSDALGMDVVIHPVRSGARDESVALRATVNDRFATQGLFSLVEASSAADSLVLRWESGEIHFAPSSSSSSSGAFGVFAENAAVVRISSPSAGSVGEWVVASSNSSFIALSGPAPDSLADVAALVDAEVELLVLDTVSSRICSSEDLAASTAESKCGLNISDASCDMIVVALPVLLAVVALGVAVFVAVVVLRRKQSKRKTFPGSQAGTLRHEGSTDTLLKSPSPSSSVSDGSGGVKDAMEEVDAEKDFDVESLRDMDAINALQQDMPLLGVDDSRRESALVNTEYDFGNEPDEMLELTKEDPEVEVEEKKVAEVAGESEKEKEVECEVIPAP